MAETPHAAQTLAFADITGPEDTPVAPPVPSSCAFRAWATLAIRELILEHASRKTQVQALRLDKAAFVSASKAVYGECTEKDMAPFLQRVTNYVSEVARARSRPS